MKALLNNGFFLILLDRKKERYRHSIRVSKRIKIEETFSENAFLIIESYWPNLYFPKISVSIYKNNHIEKSKNNSVGDNSNICISDKDSMDNLSICKPDINGDRMANNLGISWRPDKNGVDNLGIRISGINLQAERDGRAKDSSFGKLDLNRVVDTDICIPDIDTNGRANNLDTSR